MMRPAGGEDFRQRASTSKCQEVETDHGQLGWWGQRLEPSHVGVGREHVLGPLKPWEGPGDYAGSDLFKRIPVVPAGA